MPLDVAFVEEGGNKATKVTVEKVETSAVRQATFHLLSKDIRLENQSIQIKRSLFPVSQRGSEPGNCNSVFFRTFSS